ncbi:myosin heavy chain kinase a-like protein [Leishmania major strain Friedlin]|uniref:Myosin heavy chain kinase a-like protein n=1 Tax=Leishmania major TaxID=5664 RepID=Q4Q0U3_LEIMA|nr:myosin heavy chain kinase a-like protein [Leishmania major strain Friedlin]CAG9584003.1 myosin_heavy_chain_kinase_a-like_protein [Leishmania major strain Friedlin]CAJ09441.1 myosin heavy chain kinase a-like protein [Leishmania major strain Friedlin]|eukprot:XP_001687055.1 myosin heavy chain kinase a-like protein [Leishmania major strain Friedlin]
MNPATKDVASAEEESPVVCTAKQYIFDLHSYAWKESDCLIRIPRPHKGMGHGGMRVCYAVEDVDEEGAGTPMVAKMFRRNISNVVEKDYFNEGAAQCMCEEFANNFNRIHLTNIRKPNISFLQCYVVRIPRDSIPAASQRKRTGFFSYKTQDTGEVMFVMEPMLSGKFTKYNSNYGETYREDKKAALTSSEARRRTEIFEAAETFSHFTLVESGGSMLVCDLQGVNDFFTDPQIHTEDGKGLGMGNMGQEGIDKWIEKHECNDICRALGLQPLLGAVPSSTACAREENMYLGLRAQLQSQNPVRLRDLVPLTKPLEEMTEAERIEYALKVSRLTD